MTTSNQITLDHIKNYFSLDGQIEALNIAPTATGGAGIDNLEEFPPPKPCISVEKKKDTAYVKKYLDRAKYELERKQSLNLAAVSAFSINDLEDVDDATTTVGDLPEVTDLDDEKNTHIYSTYYNVPHKVYNPELNITNYREEILQQLNINPVVIVQGPTGCGKTTQVPQYILDYHASRGKYCNIIVTQPRKIAAISIAKRVCQERGWQLGTLVGYQVAMDPKISADTRLCYVTTGVFLEKLVNSKSMDKFTHVILDEIHERDQDIDFALLLVKKFLLTNSQRVKVVLMSATFDTSIFAEYFSLSHKRDLAPVIEITGKSKEVTEHYLDELKTLLSRMPEFKLEEPYIDPNLYDAIIKLMYVFDRIEKAEQNIPAENDYAPLRGGVLVFLPGYDEISTLSEKLMTALFNKKYWVIPLHSMITLAEQSKVFMKAPPDHRKVIIATNIAESSITVPDVKYVIDFCLTKSLVTDSLTNYTCLRLEWASKANCIQRKGRAGRVDIGKVYRLVPKYFYELFDNYNTPEIKRCPLTKTILQLKRLGICEPQEMLAFALDPPYAADIDNAVLQLKEALALYGKGSNHDGELTFIGDVMASLPLDIKLSKLILFGYAFSCLEECIIIAASLSLQSFFARPFQKALESYRSRLSWARYSFSDCFAYLNAYKVWKERSAQSYFLKPGGMREKEWGDQNYVQIKRIKEMDTLVREIKNRLEKHNIYVDSTTRDNSPTSNMILKLVMAGAFFPHYFLQDKLDEKEIMRELNDSDPLSTVVVTGLPPAHGLLYACTLQDMFACCGNKIDIDFEDRKAYIRFKTEEAVSGKEVDKSPSQPVEYAVYMAVKMRLLRMPMELFVFSHEEAESKMKQIRHLKESDSEKRLASNRFSVKLNPPSTLRKIQLPGPECNFQPIFISHAHDPGHFWARYRTPDSMNHLTFIRCTIMNAEKAKCLKPLDKKATVNLLCLAPYSESANMPSQYYRAQVQDVIGNGMVKVHFVDYGNDELVKEVDLRAISDDLPDLRTTPALAFECKLSHIKPSSSQHYLGLWSDDAQRWFKRTINCANNKELLAKTYSIVQDVVRLELIVSSNTGAVESINEKLIAKGFAEPAEESLTSKQNHELREKCSDYSMNNISQDSSFSSMEVSLEDTMGFNSLTVTKNKIRLRGPSSPLEVGYGGMTNIDRTRCVKIERDSVNSVSFNAEPQDQCSVMLIASHLTIGQKSDVVCARNTTLMPKILGLPTLICLMFSPYAEIRTDKMRRSYTGALCGLGYDPATGEPLYPDHDIEVDFDTEITLEDICDVNAIRMGMNMLLQSKDENKSALNQYRKVLREYIIKLLQKKRKPKELQPYWKPGCWNQIPSVMLLQPSVDNKADNPHVLPLHKPPGLSTGEA